jgi:Lipase (class 3)
MIMRRMTVAGAAIAFMIATPSMSAHAQQRGHAGPPIGRPLFAVMAAIGGKAAEVNREAMHVYETLPREGSCEDRRAHWLAILPDALLLSRYARDIYDQNHETEMRKAGLARLKLGEDHFAYFAAAGEHYAEVRVDRERRRAVVIFLGTRLDVRGDLSTDVLNFVGIETSYYQWAASLVASIVRSYPDLKIVVTGHSLGGGLALYAVLKNPGVHGFVFNPTGFSEVAWSAVSPDDRARLNASVVVISLRNFWRIEPVTALSFAGRSVLPGHIFVLNADTLFPAKLHTATMMVTALEHVAERQARGSACNGDLGSLAE